MKGVALHVLLLVAVFPVIMGDLFEAFDQNHDGSIDRQEYTQGMTKITAALDGEMPERVSFFSQLHVTEGFWKAFTSSVAMILATEIGDKTFFIAAVMSMRYDRSAVFGGAILALVIMTILSSLMGQVLPAILPKQYTHILGGILFLYFGIKLVNESRSMEANRVSEELEEVEEELLHEKKKDVDEENPNGVSQPKGRKMKMNWYQVSLESLSLTFLAEWGDRSQIATIALSAAKNPYGVTVGGCLGHVMCTGLAVLGGRMLAARISEKTVAFWGGLVFFVFGVHSLFFEK
jgi:putative Ca2+/H+ antiporter (TMEM165/GDT1 family)